MGGVGVSSELTPRIGKVALREFTAHGITTYADLSRHRRRDLLAIHGIGPKSIQLLDEELASRGLRFADEAP